MRGRVDATTVMGSWPLTAPAPSSTLTVTMPTGPLARSTSARTSKVCPSRLIATPSGRFEISYLKPAGSAPSGSRTICARSTAVASSPAATLTPVGTKVTGWFWVASTFKGRVSVEVNAESSPAAPSETSKEKEDLPDHSEFTWK